MKKRLIIIFLLVSCIGFSQANGAQESSEQSVAKVNWNTLKSESGKFEVAITGVISEQPLDKEKTSTFKISFDADNMYYLVSSTKHKSDLESSIDELLEVSISTFSEQVKGTISNRKEVFLENTKGLYAEMDMTESGFKLEYYVYMRGIYQYQVVVYATYASYNSTVANRFFKSFKTLD
ncbi:MAG: hypothetical protein PSN34_06665 [Urechidicola sp.]|nr:hypothetical protein [Urechidicola sp.]